MLCNRPTCTETGAALALPGTLQERDTPAPPRAGVVTLPLPIRLRSCAGRAAGPTPAAEPQPGSHREPGARESQYPDILAMFGAVTIPVSSAKFAEFDGRGERMARSRFCVDVGGTFIDRRWLWFTMASASDPGVRWAQSVLAANADQDHVPPCRLGDATARPESIHARAQILSRFEVRGVSRRKRYRRSGPGIAADACTAET